MNMIDKVLVKCYSCNEFYQITKESYRRKKLKNSTYCRNCHSKNIQKGIKRPQFSEDNSKRWKGGEYVSSDGYIMVKIKDSYLESGRQVYKRKHVLIYENFLGRKLKTKKGGGGEQIHHIDGNKQNNEISNLVLCSDTKDHRLLHGSLERAAFELVRSGVIKFDIEKKIYHL